MLKRHQLNTQELDLEAVEEGETHIEEEAEEVILAILNNRLMNMKTITLALIIIANQHLIEDLQLTEEIAIEDHHLIEEIVVIEEEIVIIEEIIIKDQEEDIKEVIKEEDNRIIEDRMVIAEEVEI